MSVYLLWALLTQLIVSSDTIEPEVTQEGLLQPFYTYADVTLFHFHVPHEVIRATWEFAAFMDDPSCPVREVHVLVQHGSYPVVSKNNETFRDYMYIQRTDHKVTTRSAYQPSDTTILPIYNPLPGSWFAAAYIPDWIEQMQQEGIVHKCRYSLGSIAMWNQKDEIHTLNIGETESIITHENLSYYRFYVPSNTWFLEVNITNCHIREEIINHDTGERLFRWCISSVTLQARSLPPSDPENGVTNITQGGGHVFTETRPYSDGYYYLLVNTEGETSLDITISRRECGGAMRKPQQHVRRIKSTTFTQVSSKREAQFVGLASPTNNTTSASTTLTPKKLTEDSPTDEDWVQMTHKPEDAIFRPKWDPDYVPDETTLCYPILPLARIKHPSDFMDTFLIQGPEWYSTWLAVKDDVPVFTHLTLLPFTDIGGTLSVNLRMDDLLMNATSQLITIVGCIRMGRPPEVVNERLTCSDKELTLNITSLSSNTLEDFILIPFPEPDIWFLALQTICYYKGVAAPCIIDQVMVSIDIRNQPCVFTGDQPCGAHGLCQETRRGMFFFTSCICMAGWTGWGCEDGAEAEDWNTFLTGLCMLTLSNIFFIPPAIIAARRRLYAQSLLFTATMVASIFYHACDNEVLSYCLTKYEVLQFTDFFFSLLCFWMTIVGLAGIEETYYPLLHTLGVIIIAPAVTYSRTALASFTVPMAVATTIAICHVLYKRWHTGCWPKIHRQRLLFRGMGVGLALIGLIMFALIQTKDNYKFVHSAWHVIIALSLVFLLPSQKPQSPGNKVPNSDGVVSDDSELIDVGLTTVDYTASSPVFQVASDVDFLLTDSNEGQRDSNVIMKSVCI